MVRSSLLLAAATLAVACTAAEARDGCGRGLYFDGYRCVREHYAPPPDRYYGPPRDEGPVVRFDFGGGGGGGGRYAAPVRGRDGRLSCAQRGYTVQDGLCKPYTGR
jgi:hypothetical protein